MAKNTKNTIIYGGIQWNSAMTVRLLEKPEDDNIIFTFHFYEPLWFTHQKAYWVPAMDPNETVSYPALGYSYGPSSAGYKFNGVLVNFYTQRRLLYLNCLVNDGSGSTYTTEVTSITSDTVTQLL